MTRQEELENDYQVALKSVQIDIAYLAHGNKLTDQSKRDTMASLFYLEGLCREAIRAMLKTYTETEDKQNV